MKKAGIYKITNTYNNKFYIGSSINIDKRWYRHITDLNCCKHHNKHLQRAWKKYGKNSFTFEIIELCKPEDLLKSEQFYLDLLNPEYNHCKIANSRLGIKASKETLEKMSKSQKGKKQSKETITKRAEKLKGNKFGSRIISEEEKFNRRKNSKLGRPVIAFNEKEELEFPSVKQAVREFNLSSASPILKVIQGKNKSCKGYKWKYKDENL